MPGMFARCNPCNRTPKIEGDFLISLKLARAEGLLNSDVNDGVSDPFCKVFVLNQERQLEPIYQTKTIRDSLNPVWNEEVTFGGFGVAQHFEVRIYDKDQNGPDDHLGCVHLSMWQPSESSGGIVLDKKAVIKGWSSDYKFRTEETPKGHFFYQAKAWKGKNMTPPRGIGLKEEFTISLTLVKATDLAKSDLHGVGKSDPYCKVFVLTDRVACPYEEVHTTKTMPDTCNPEWNETVSFAGWGYSQPFEVRIYDSDKLSSDDPLGFVQLCASKPSTKEESKEQNCVIVGSNLDGTLQCEKPMGHLFVRMKMTLSQGGQVFAA